MVLDSQAVDRLSAGVRRERLVATALELCSIYSPTGSAGGVADRLAQMLAQDGFEVERPVAGWPAAPAVAVRFRGSQPGRTIQFNGHLDTVHLPFVGPKIEGHRLTGSGSADMKAGVAAAVEALRALRDTGLLTAGEVLLTAHDLHESPWGDGSQLDRLIDQGYVGHAVLIPEYLRDVLAVVGRGQATFQVRLSRPGPPVHEVMRPLDQPSVIAAGAELVRRFAQWNEELSSKELPYAGSASVFIGQFHSGEIYNQFPAQCLIEGTRRWLPGQDAEEVESDFRRRVEQLAADTMTRLELKYLPVRDAFYLDPDDPLVAIFQQARQLLGDAPLPLGGKPFVDDGSSFWANARVAAITHGPLAAGAHTLGEWVSIDDLVRVARLYALTAVMYCRLPGEIAIPQPAR
jgi:acetylornithine deacetylase/succinyl-diaminopimelate desuccinylase-like protein